MKSVIAVLLSVVLVAQAKVVQNGGAQAQQTTNQPIQLTDLISQAQANVNELARQIQQQLNLPDHEVVINTVKEQSNQLVTSIQDYMKNVTEEVNKNPELTRMWDDVKTKLNKAVEDVNKGIPNAQAQINELQSNFQSAVQVLLKESDNAAKSIGQNSEKLQEDIAKFAKQAVDIAVQASQNMNEHLQKAAAVKN